MKYASIFIKLMLLLSYIDCLATQQTNNCERYPCANNGVCNELSTGRECVCQLGYRGSDCLIDLCTAKPCLNGATCVQGHNTRHCVCPLGYSGEDCIVEECVARPCKNGATCIPKFMDRQCVCPLGFKGADCEIDICKGEPCLHDGQCIPGLYSASCICQIGYTGRFCETVVCDPNPCVNGGECYVVNDDYQCRCTHEGGKRCQYNDIVPWGKPLLPTTYILPNDTRGLIYIPKIIVKTSSSYIYGLRVVATGNPTPFHIQIWRQEGDRWRLLTLKYDKKIELSTNTPIQDIKFSDLGIKCGAVGNWDLVGFFFPEGSDGIGLHDCKSDCDILLNNYGVSDIDVGKTLEFEYDRTFKYSFGVKVYFAVEGEFGRNLDSKNCPENTALPDETFGDRGDIVDRKEYNFSFSTAYNTEDGLTCNYTVIEGGMPDSILLLVTVVGAVLGGLLLVAIIIVVVLAIKLCRRRLRKPELPSCGIDNETLGGTANDGYTSIICNGSDNSDRSSLEFTNNSLYASVHCSTWPSRQRLN